MQYFTPNINLIEIKPFASQQQTGTPPPTEAPAPALLNPDCSDADCDDDGVGWWCDPYPDPNRVWVMYFLPGKECPPQELCTINVNGEALTCILEEDYANNGCLVNQCDDTSGIILMCSGEVETCDSVNSVSVDCGEDDSDDCVET